MEDIKRINSARQYIHEGRIDEAIKLCLELTELGSAEAPDYLGVLYRAGKGMPIDKKKAEEYFLLSHNRGYAMGTYHLAGEYQRGSKISQALPLYKSIAEINPSAAYWAFRCLEPDASLSKEVAVEADKYLNLAAKTGHTHANKTIALRTLKGKFGLHKIPFGIYLYGKTIFLGVQSIIKNERPKFIDSVGPN